MNDFINFLKNKYDVETLEEILENGCKNNISGMIYHEDTSEIYKKYGDHIIEIIIKESKKCGHDDVFKFLAATNHYNNILTCEEYITHLVWLAAEIAAEIALIEIATESSTRAATIEAIESFDSWSRKERLNHEKEHITN